MLRIWQIYWPSGAGAPAMASRPVKHGCSWGLTSVHCEFRNTERKAKWPRHALTTHLGEDISRRQALPPASVGCGQLQYRAERGRRLSCETPRQAREQFVHEKILDTLRKAELGGLTNGTTTRSAKTAPGNQQGGRWTKFWSGADIGRRALVCKEQSRIRAGLAYCHPALFSRQNSLGRHRVADRGGLGGCGRAGLVVGPLRLRRTDIILKSPKISRSIW